MLLLPLLLVRLVLVEMVVTPGIQELLVLLLLLKRVNRRRRRRKMLRLLLLLLGVMVEDGLVVPKLLLIHVARAGGRDLIRLSLCFEDVSKLRLQNNFHSPL